MRKIVFLLLTIALAFAGCKKEEIVTITNSTGKVIEQSTNAPLTGIKVAVSNGQRELVTTTTNADGRFKFTVDFDKVTASDSLLLDGRPNLPFRKYELKGMGKAEYDYGTLWLYDKSDAMYLPQVTTDSIISVDTTSAVLACAVKSDGGFTVTKRGVCYATRQLPDFSDNVKISGSGTGVYICEIGNLMPATEYYYRAFAINAIDTVYGEQKSFRTLAKTYSVYVSAKPSKGGEVTGGGVFEEGLTRTVVATANTGYTFINWMENGNQVSSDASYSFTLNGNRNLVAHFQVKTYTVTTSSNPVDGGNTTGDGTFNHGQSCTLRATSAEDYIFLRWTKNATQVSTEHNYTFDVTESGNYVAHFTNQLLAFTVSVSANPSNGGTVTGSGTYEMGQICTVSATANSGYVFTNWTENGTVVSEQANYTFLVAGDRILKANFTISQNACSIIVSANPTNGGTVAGGGSFNQGQSCTVTATPNMGFVFVKWTENGVQVSDNPSYTFTVSGNRTLVAQFQMVTYTASTSSNPSNGGVTSGGGTYQQGHQCTVTATANAGFSFTNWTENGNVVSSDASYTFTVNSNRSLVANFALRTYTINISANPSNGGGVSGGGTYSFGQSCTVTATAVSEYSFVNWKEDGVIVSNNSTYNFIVENDRALVANFVIFSLPIITTNPVTNIAVHSATAGGNVTNGGGYEVTERGVCWGTIHNPNISYNHIVSGTGEGQFTCEMTGLEPGITYYVRAYAKNSLGTSYGNEESFTTLIPQAPVGAVNGLFSVSNNRKVWFAQGNLQYQTTSNTWRFADHQWDVIGATNTNISQFYSGWIDLFGWGTSGYNHGAVCWQPWSVSQTSSDYYAYGNVTYNLYDQTGQADWGYNEILNGGNQTNIWRTITDEELEYVFITRETPSQIRYVKATVNNVWGVLLLPDNWDATTYSLNNPNIYNANYDSNIITATLWSTVFEPAGAVFFPATGSREGVSYNYSNLGLYYTSSAVYNQWSHEYIAGVFGFGEDWLGAGNSGWEQYRGCSVRLIQDY